MSRIAIAIHGGAGDLPFFGMTPDRENEFRSGLDNALQKGFEILKNNGSAVNAVEASINALEDNPLFNAGKGSAINRFGEVEMDASIMDGRSLRAGAISNVKGVKNPVSLAKKIMEHCEHLYLSGEGAADFAKEMQLEFMPPSYFITQERIAQWEDQHAKTGTGGISIEHGTAGCVALDINGDLAAGTSTGGLVNKRKGRIGDTAIIGAGTYADNESAAVSCTGTGEYIIRTATAHEICALHKYTDLPLANITRVVLKKINSFGGQFGAVVMSRSGTINYVHNTERMYRAWIDIEGNKEIHIY